MDKKGWIIIVLCVLGIVGNNWYAGRKQQEWKDQQALLEAAKPKPEVPPAGADGTPATPADPSAAPDKPGGELVVTPPAPKFAEAEHVLLVEDANPKHTVRYIFTNRGGGIKRVEFPGDPVHANTDAPVVMNNAIERAIGALSDGVDRVETGEYKLISSGPDHVTYEGVTSSGMLARKHYTVDPAQPKGLPSLRLSLGLTNPGTAEVNTAGWYLFAGSSAPLLADEYEAQTGVAWMDGDGTEFETETMFKGGWFSSAKAVFQQDIVDTKWFGVINQYYSILLAPTTPGPRSTWSLPVNTTVEGRRAGEAKSRLGIQSALGLGGGVVAPGATAQHEWKIFAGPKNYDALKKVQPGFEEVLLYGDMPIFGWMASPFSRMLNWALHRIKTVVPDFGIAIIILTIIIRFLIWPLHAKAQRTMKRMALLNPIMQELRTKHEGDPQKLNQEMMKLYQEYGINPLGGCLPILLQMPIFFGFYRMLQYASELRHEPFLWVKDLAQPDTLFYIPLPLFGYFPVNVLPLIMAATMVVQMRMTPMTGDKMQQRIFTFMPFIFLIICYNFASALSLYWTTTNIFSIAQSWWMKRQPEVTLEKRKPKPKPKASDLSSMRRQMMGLPPEKEKKPGNRPPRTGG
jgi:YidC/Oxa1 family membrane protein insertase